MTSAILQVQHLYHKYNAAWAIKDINFEIAGIGVTGLLGSNGAGKSTTMNILCGVLSQTSGSVRIGDMDLKTDPRKAKRLIGFLPQNAPLLTDLTVDEYLRYCANLRLVPGKKIGFSVSRVKEKCGLGRMGSRLIKNLSGGFRQRVGIAQAIVHQPKLIVLDEPTNGLDPVQIVEVRKLIQEIGSEDAVIFSSHILTEIGATCDDIKMIEQGRIIFAGTRDTFSTYVRPDSFIVRMACPPALGDILALTGVKQAEFLDDLSIRVRYTGTKANTEEFTRISQDRNWHLQEIFLEKPSLDEIFSKLSKSETYPQ